MSFYVLYSCPGGYGKLEASCFRSKPPNSKDIPDSTPLYDAHNLSYTCTILCYTHTVQDRPTYCLSQSFSSIIYDLWVHICFKHQVHNRLLHLHLGVPPQRTQIIIFFNLLAWYFPFTCCEILCRLGFPNVCKQH